MVLPVQHPTVFSLTSAAGFKSVAPAVLQTALSLQPGLASQAAGLVGNPAPSQGMSLQSPVPGLLGAASAPEHSDAEVKAVSKKFEAIFMRMLLKEMRNSVEKNGLLGDSNAMDIFQSMQDDQISDSVSAAGGIGIGSLIYQKLKSATVPHLRTYS